MMRLQKQLVNSKECEINSRYEQEESHKMIPMQLLIFEKNRHEDCKDC